MPLTGSVLTTYGELKNQYGLINTAGQILVSETDAANFENSNTLEEFLEKYGVLGELGTGDTIQVINPEYETAWDDYYNEYNQWMAEKPDPTNPIYIIPGQPSTSYNLYDDFLWATAQCYACAMSALSNALGLPGNSLTDSSGNKVLDYTNNNITLYDKSGNVILSGQTYPSNKGCYCHVLSHLLEEGSYSTTTGQSITIYQSSSSDPYSHWWTDGNGYSGSTAAKLATILSENANPVLKACGDTGKDITQNSSEIEKLMSDYYFDSNGTKQLKTLQQKIVDLDYAMANNLMTDQEAYDAIEHFVNKDLIALNKTEDQFDQNAYDSDVADWEAKKPNEPTVAQYIDQETRAIKDLDKAQWYVQ